MKFPGVYWLTFSMDRWKPFVSLVILLGLAYGFSLAPGLSWANNGVDGGDLISAAATGGIAHPSGYPLYLLLAGLFQRIPVGSLAFRTNLMSVLCSLVAAGLLYKLLEKQLGSTLPALLAVLAYGLSPLVWSQAVITEVYALQALLNVAILSALLSPVRKSAMFILQGMLCGLAQGNHLTSLFLIPLLFFFQPPVIDGKMRWLNISRRSVTVIFLRFTGIVIGLLVYVILPLRASANPPLNWGNPVTLENFWWLVSAQVYRDAAFSLSVFEVVERVRGVGWVLLRQFTIVGLGLGLYGVSGKLSGKLRVGTMWLFASYSLFTVLYGYSDSYVYMLPVSLALSVWIGFGLDDLFSMVREREHGWGWLLMLVILAGLLTRSLYLFPELDASRDLRAEVFGNRVMESAPKDAIIFTDTDEETFGLWYFHFALGQRPDLVIVASGLLPFKWYQVSLRSIYPDLNLPISLPWPENVVADNPTRPACFIRSIDQAELDCLSP